MRRLLSHLARFRKSEQGNAVIEFILVLPLFATATLMPLTAYGYYADYVRAQKATYSIADVISREQLTLTPAYFNTMFSLYQELTGEAQDVAIRVSYVDYDPISEEHRVLWHRSRSGSGIDEFADSAPNTEFLSKNMPTMADYEALILVESRLKHQPFSTDSVFDPLTFSLVAISRPRNGPQICVTNRDDPNTPFRTC